jgi:Golgi phosphoprotein 3 (GPP34)
VLTGRSRTPSGPGTVAGMTLLAEDVLLLLLDDASGKPIVDGTKLDRVLAGALLLELALAGRVTPAT